jgi:hypothetical protein
MYKTHHGDDVQQATTCFLQEKPTYERCRLPTLKQRTHEQATNRASHIAWAHIQMQYSLLIHSGLNMVIRLHSDSSETGWWLKDLVEISISSSQSGECLASLGVNAPSEWLFLRQGDFCLRKCDHLAIEFRNTSFEKKLITIIKKFLSFTKNEEYVSNSKSDNSWWTLLSELPTVITTLTSYCRGPHHTRSARLA